MTTRVLFDHQIFQAYQYGGVSRYFSELLRAFLFDPAMNAKLALRFSDNPSLRELPGMRDQLSPIPDLFPSVHFLGKRSITRIWRRLNPSRNPEHVNQLLALDALASNDWDIFHPTYYDDYFLQSIGSRPFVITVYDLIHEHFPGMFHKSSATAVSAQKRRILAAASRIIAISESTKRDIITVFGINPNQIRVIYLAGSSPLIKSPVGREPREDVPDRYLLYVGTRSGYKNFSGFIEAIVPLLRRDRKLFVVCAGPPFSPPESKFLQQLGVDNSVIWKKSDDATLLALYKNAMAFVFPSLYEGFGIPVIEAFEQGCPAILSNTSSLPEVGGSAAIYFSPTDRNAMCASVERVVGSSSLRDELRKLGKQRASEFSWSKTARETKEVYQEILQT